MAQDIPHERPATLGDAVPAQHASVVAAWLGGEHASPVGHATVLPGTGDGGTGGVGAASAVPPPDRHRRVRIRRRLRRRIAEPSDVDIITKRIATELGYGTGD